MTCLAIIGNASGGKSTLCRQLDTILSLSVYPMDQLQWKPAWVAVSEEEFQQKHEQLLAQDRWLINGWGPLFWLRPGRLLWLCDVFAHGNCLGKRRASFWHSLRHTLQNQCAARRKEQWS